MRTLLTVAAAAAALAVTTPSFAQSVRIDTPAASVRLGERGYNHHHYRHRDRAVHREIYGRADCRTVTVRKHRPNGNVVITKRRICH